ncbi:glucose PTS transporter subunit IIA [Propioniciclava sp.]|uniref:glucose PTS transporter subunit IIA n=1 Tax=Propioniciclava sp. TaxID=2038686 RepID=UPI00260B26E3|nr:glucose PTS transporter subunit IIA [Propioniciclava sp.]
MQDSAAAQIVDAVGGPGNITALTHCATRLRFELKDASGIDQTAVEKIPGVLGAVPQSGDRYQVVIGGAVQGMYTDIMNLPQMSSMGAQSDADVKAAARSKARGKVAWLDAFFEYLSNSFRPLLGVLLGASLIIAFAAVLDALGVVDFRASDKAASWIFVDAMWRSVFYFLPIMVAYNASKALNIDPWVGATVMGAVMTPEFISLSSTERFADTVCTPSPIPGADPTCVANIFGLPMQLNGYGGQVFVPLITVAVLALVYKALVRIFPENVQMVFVPFFSMVIMIPVTAFLLGPLGIWLGTALGTGLNWLNTTVPFLFAILIPMVYPFLVPLGLHWPLNALMLANIQSLGYDFIQGPMGTWNFACFGATAGVLFIAMRDKETQMRQTATGALAAGLLGGISEPSLYGIHLRFKKIYPRMLVGCFAGGLTIAILGSPFGGVRTSAFAFTSLLTIPVFSPMWVYAIAIAVAFVVAMMLIIITDYRTPEQKEESRLAREAEEREHALHPHGHRDATAGAVAATGAGTAAAASAAPVAVLDAQATTFVGAPMAGQVVTLDEVEDKVFASRALGEGVGIRPDNGRVVAPVGGTLATVTKTGHAFGLKTDDGVEVLVHVGIDTVQMKGDGFSVKVAKGDRVNVGDVLADVDLDAVRTAGFDTTTIVTVTNTKAMASVTPLAGQSVSAGDPVIDVVR